MTSKADFTDAVWARLERAPIVAGMAISLADPGGPIEAVKESTAAVRSVTEAAQADSGNELVNTVAKSVVEKVQHRHNPLGDFKPRGRGAPEEILEELRAVNALLEEKATADEAAAFREWLVATAKRSADAAKEGGFLGFNEQRVSEGEQHMLDTLGELFSSPAP